MSGQTSTQQTQQQASTTSPWAPTTGTLKNIIGQVNQGNLSPTSGQTSATGTLVDAATGLPNYGTAGEGAVNNLFNSSTTPQQGMLSSAYGQEQGALSPMLSSEYTNPYTDPALQQAMGTMNNQITNQIEGQAAAAGRPMGTNADSSEALALGLSQGEGGLLANEFNTLSGNQLTAANQLGTAAGNTASGITGQQQTQLGNQQAGITAAGEIPGLVTQPASTALQAQNLQAGLPLTNVAAEEGLINPIASLGGQSTGSGTSTTSQQTPATQNIIGGAMLGASLLSDARLKKDKKQIGMLYDGTPVHSFEFKGSNVPRIGLLAQNVEKRTPQAVQEVGGVKMVDYGKATERSRKIGMLHDMAA